MIYFVLSFITVIALAIMAAQDFRERMIYSFPVLILTVMWMVYSIILYWGRMRIFVLAWTITVILYMVYKIFHIWGDGDSDVFLLFISITLCTFEIDNLLQFGFLICVFLAAAQIISLIAGVIEARIKNRKLNWDSGLAVVPGFAMVLIIMIIYGIIRKGSFA